MKRCETSKVLLEWILPVHLRFQWLLDYLRKTEVSSNSDAKIQSDRNSQQELSDSSSSRIPSTPTGLIAWKINMACCHCEALQRRQRLLGGNVANWKLFGPSLVRMHVLRFWCTNCQPLPILGFQTHLQQWSKKPSHTRLFCCCQCCEGWNIHKAFLPGGAPPSFLSKLYSPTHPTLHERSLPHPALVERGLSMFIPLKFFPSWPPAFYGVSSAFRWKQQPCHLWEMIIQFRGPSWEVGFS